MNDDNSQVNGTSSDRTGERVGDLLRQERLTRRIAVETIAKDLKLNVAYVKALEDNDYASLPADPYVRVYIRSIANYLSLDPERILRAFYEERGVSVQSYQEERSTKLDVTVQEAQRSRVSWVVIAIVIVVLAALSYVANKKGWISSSAPQPESEQQAPAEETGEAVDSADSAEQGEGGVEEQDSADVEATEEPETKSETEETSQAPPAARDTMRLRLSAVKDSVWVQVFADGVSWRNFVYPKSARFFTAVDSFNLHVGHNALMRYALDGKRLSVKGRSVVAFKLDSNGVKKWDLSTWNRIFKDRL